MPVHSRTLTIVFSLVIGLFRARFDLGRVRDYIQSRKTCILNRSYFLNRCSSLFLLKFFRREVKHGAFELPCEHTMEVRMLKLTTLAIVTALMAPVALAGPAERLGRLDNRLDYLERTGVIKQGSRLDYIEDRIDRRENKIDRREDRRDRAVNNGPLDRLEDRLDRLENIQDRREDRWDRRY